MIAPTILEKAQAAADAISECAATLRALSDVELVQLFALVRKIDGTEGDLPAVEKAVRVRVARKKVDESAAAARAPRKKSEKIEEAATSTPRPSKRTPPSGREEGETSQQIRAALARRPMTRVELNELTGRVAATGNVLQRLQRNGVVERVGEERGAAWRLT